MNTASWVNKKSFACENHNGQFQNGDRQFHCFSHLIDSFKKLLATDNIGTTGMSLINIISLKEHLGTILHDKQVHTHPVEIACLGLKIFTMHH